MIQDLFNKFRLDGRLAVITGGAGLLGERHAEAILEAGGIPVLVDINENLAKEKARKLSERYGREAIGAFADITRKKSITSLCDRLVADYGTIDILINNAANDPKIRSDPGHPPWSRFENYSLDAWKKDIDVSLTGSLICSQIFGTRMAQQKKGVILNISSDLGIIAPDQRIYKTGGTGDDLQPVKPVSYSVAKHGIIGLTRYLATYWADKGIRVNALCPGGVYNGQPSEFVDKLVQLIPLGRMADADEYKPAIVFLVSDASSYMTGSVIIIDGGRTCW
jgi:NAD(P)-dependent dehydrogenase (short-subunit alcohol dehydrogenase family)